MKTAMERFTDDELRVDWIDRGGGFVASPFVQHEIYREAVYIFYGKLSVYLKALECDAGDEWAVWVGEIRQVCPLERGAHLTCRWRTRF